MNATVTLPPETVPVIAEPDVCVIGAGAAGVAAAVAAARLGLNTLLVERYGFCGGATVAGLSGTICGLYSSGPNPTQIVFGFAGEFAALMRDGGGVCSPVRFGRTMLLPHDSFVWKETADHLLEGSRVQILYHSVFLKAYCDERGHVVQMLLRTPEGLAVVRPRAVVDASGDAEIVNSLGAPITVGHDGVVQTPTMVFRVGGVDMRRFLELDPGEICAMVRDSAASGMWKLPRDHVYLFPLPNGREVLCNMTRITFPDGTAPLGIRAADLTFAEIEGRRQVRAYASFLRDRVPGFAESYIVESGTQVGIRQTRSLVGMQRLTNADVMSGRKIPGAATYSAWPIECHGAEGLSIVYLKDDTYDVPFETLIPTRGGNVVAAGRCLSAEHEALASARVTAQCFGMGYAAGASCGLMIREAIVSQDLTGSMVAAWMRQNGLKTASEA